MIALYLVVDQGFAAITVYLSVLQYVSDVIRLAFIRYYVDKQRHIGPILLGQRCFGLSLNIVSIVQSDFFIWFPKVISVHMLGFKLDCFPKIVDTSKDLSLSLIGGGTVYFEP